MVFDYKNILFAYTKVIKNNHIRKHLSIYFNRICNFLAWPRAYSA